jgi:hypothetical protein
MAVFHALKRLLVLVLLQVPGSAQQRQQQPQPQRRQLCLLPVGDSITQADRQHDSYRLPLWRKLLDANGDSTEVLYTGSMVNHWDESPSTTHPQASHNGRPFPPHHEGHAGWTSENLLKGLDPGARGGGQSGGSGASGSLVDWTHTYESVCVPTCMLIHIGTNDVCPGIRGGDRLSATQLLATSAAVVDNIRQMIQVVAAQFPDAAPLHAVVAAPIPSCCQGVHDALIPAVRAAFDADANLGLPARSESTFWGSHVCTRNDHFTKTGLGQT